LNYFKYELAHAFINPLRFWSSATRMALDNPFNPLSLNPFSKSMSAALEVFESLTKRYGKPAFGIESTSINGQDVAVTQKISRSLPFCDLVQFARDETVTGRRNDPKVLIVAPMSGHYATLLRGTVKSMLPEHDVYVTDWKDARAVPIADGRFDVDDYIDYIIDFVQHLGPNTHVMAVCQPAVPALAATAIMAKRDMPIQPASLTLMGGPIDTRRNPTAVNTFAMGKPMSWFENNVISVVPFPQAGFMRRVYPGFIQLSGFMAMNFERHQTAYRDLFDNLVKGDCDSVKQHTDFYDEYLAVMDLPAEFYLQTVKSVFKDHDLPNRRMKYRSEIVDCSAIRKTAIMTIEGERDDICGVGQTEAAHDLCTGVPADEHYHYLQLGVGHYGVFNGTRFRTEIQPRIREMIRTIEFKRRATHAGVAPAIEIGRVVKPMAIRPESMPRWNDVQPSGKPN
jgi:poly(3-hydroxybutyrate) depolymerase